MAEETTLVRVGRTDEIPLNEAKRVDVNGTPVAVFHLPLGFFAIGDTCSHEESSLSEGFVDEDMVECPKHGAQFEIQTGRNRSLPATKPVASYRVVVEGEEVFVEAPNG
jgi:3-phenylpropionate/trans-cinnamate dioxygenase ferredoxin component